jgi:dethiobiotin synthetase
MSGVRILGRLPDLPEPGGNALRQAFEDSFDLSSFAEVWA